MLMDLLGEDRTYGAAVERHGKLFLCGEFGGYAACNADGVAIVEDGLRRVLHTLGVTPDDNPPAPRHDTRWLKVDGARHYVFASRAGVAEPVFELGDRVEKDQLAARVFDPYAPWSAPQELRFAGNGVVVCKRSFARVEAGDCLAVLAADAHWQ
jgi:predicted deacylase